MLSQSWALDQRIRVYLLEEHESCAEFVETLAVKFVIVGQSAELDPAIVKTDYRLLSIRESIPTLQELIYSDDWSLKNTKQLDAAIENAVLLSKSIAPFWLNLVQITMKEQL